MMFIDGQGSESSPDEEGIKTDRARLHALNYLSESSPDEEGIKTLVIFNNKEVFACPKAALMKKGLRRLLKVYRVAVAMVRKQP